LIRIFKVAGDIQGFSVRSDSSCDVNTTIWSYGLRALGEIGWNPWPAVKGYSSLICDPELIYYILRAR